MFDLKLSTHRRGFLGRVAAGAAAVGLGSVVGPVAAAAESTSAADPAFEAWLNKITGKHKSLYDSPEVNDGFCFIWARVWLNTCNATYGTTDADNSAAIVLRHFSMPLACQDSVWAKYKLGEFIKFNDAKTSAPSVRNPWFKMAAADQMIPGIGVDDLIAKGVLVGVCNVALTVFSGMIASKMGGGMTGDAVKADLVANLVPGVVVVPSGVLAVNRTQEKGCTYTFAG
ncbi:MAG TPA: twin-arginine translocation signal domain-containing protein [Gemmatimonadales bacterium]|jgi:intracellular sulfur oxidation DsrE/DsrF family protein|nr:twin-arginine translocation signal domain-containing protein [Gemmatimonadales bacterium]